MTYDCFTFNGEYDMLEIRLNILSFFVDKFILVEGFETFSGNPKSPMFLEKIDRFKQWSKKIVYYVVPDYSDEEIKKQAEARSYVDTNAFRRSFYQKEMIRKVLKSLNPNDDDVVYYGDVDEIWTSKVLIKEVSKFRQLGYSYYLNNRSPEDWRGTIMTTWGYLKDKCLNDLRANPVHIIENGGWHFSNLGGVSEVLRKIESYDHQEVNIPMIKDKLAEQIENNEDFLQRGFKFWVEETGLPSYIMHNKDKWIQKGLWKY